MESEDSTSSSDDRSQPIVSATVRLKVGSVCVCVLGVHVCVRVRTRVQHVCVRETSVCVRACASVFVCVCVCVCTMTGASFSAGQSWFVYRSKDPGSFPNYRLATIGSKD